MNKYLRIGSIFIWMFITAPLVAMFVLSFCSARFPHIPWPGWSVKWYIDALSNMVLMNSIFNSLVVGFLSALIGSPLGFLSGYWISRIENLQIRDLIFVSMASPAIIPFFLFGISLSSVLNMLGVQRSLFTLVLAHTVVFSPIATGLFVNRIAKLDPNIEFAARELGASEKRIAFQIVALQIWRTFFIAGALIFILSWDEYSLSWLLTGFDKTFPVQISILLESTTSPAIDASGSLIVLLFIFALLCYRKIKKIRHSYHKNNSKNWSSSYDSC